MRPNLCRFKALLNWSSELYCWLELYCWHQFQQLTRSVRNKVPTNSLTMIFNLKETIVDCSAVLLIYVNTGVGGKKWNGILPLLPKPGHISWICLWWVKLILAPVSYMSALAFKKAVFIEIQPSNFFTVRFLTFEMTPNGNKLQARNGIFFEKKNFGRNFLESSFSSTSPWSLGISSTRAPARRRWYQTLLVGKKNFNSGGTKVLQWAGRKNHLGQKDSGDQLCELSLKR